MLTMKLTSTLLVATAGAIRLFAAEPATNNSTPSPGLFDETLTLSHHLATNFIARTNGRSEEITSSRTPTNASWNTNFYFWGCSNLTAMTHANSNTLDTLSFRKTALSRLHVITAGHLVANNQMNAFSNQWVLFVDTANKQHWARCIGSRSRCNGTNGDYTLMVLERPLPRGIQPMPIVWPATLSTRLTNGIAAPWPFIQTCQHSRALSEFGFKLGSPHPIVGGDSGSPNFICFSNRLYYVPLGFNGTYIKSVPGFEADWHALTRQAGYATNDYPLRVEPLSQFPEVRTAGPN